MFRRIIGEKYFCGLDVGSRTIKASLMEARESRQLAVVGIFETRTAGFNGSSVTDLGDFARSVNDAVSGLSKKSRVKISQVYLGIGGELVQRRIGKAVIPLLDRGSKVIARRDAERIRKQARLLGVKVEEVVIQDFPQVYRVDDVNIAQNPVGLYGRKLEVETFLLTVNNTVLKNMTKAVNRAGYDVADVFSTAFSTAGMACGEYDQRQGCVLIDMGSAVTEVLIFKGAQLRGYEQLPFGGAHFTRVISDALNVSLDLAEEIKEAYASLDPGAYRDNEEILIKREDGYLPVRKSLIIESISPLAAALCNEVRDVLHRSGLREHLNAGVFLTGGGALMSGLAERIEEAAGLNTRTAQPQIAVKHLPNAPKFLPALGLARTGFNHSAGVGRMKSGGSVYRRGLEKIKELYQEYF
ncbi:MAG: cell division protein FtsA [Candidatus Omnitrophota bacterium]